MRKKKEEVKEEIKKVNYQVVRSGNDFYVQKGGEFISPKLESEDACFQFIKAMESPKPETYSVIKHNPNVLIGVGLQKHIKE